VFFSQEEWLLRKDAKVFLKIRTVGMIEKCLFFKVKVIQVGEVESEVEKICCAFIVQELLVSYQ